MAALHRQFRLCLSPFVQFLGDPAQAAPPLPLHSVQFCSEVLQFVLLHLVPVRLHTTAKVVGPRQAAMDGYADWGCLISA
eukprot:15573309-Heterocapsa_arctica.AAC.1